VDRGARIVNFCYNSRWLPIDKGTLFVTKVISQNINCLRSRVGGNLLTAGIYLEIEQYG